MQSFTASRNATTPDEIWLLTHPSVFTLGTNADSGHVLAADDIPVVPVDRGGQVTYHGPGQLIAYVLLDLKRLRLGVRDLVLALEQSVVALLGDYGLSASGKAGAPGVYIDGAKIASIGLRIRRNRSYHGIALNVDPNLEHFSRINPCGFAGLPVTSMRELGITADEAAIGDDLLTSLATQLRLAPQPPTTD